MLQIKDHLEDSEHGLTIGNYSVPPIVTNSKLEKSLQEERRKECGVRGKGGQQNWHTELTKGSQGLTQTGAARMVPLGVCIRSSAHVNGC